MGSKTSTDWLPLFSMLSKNPLTLGPWNMDVLAAPCFGCTLDIEVAGWNFKACLFWVA